MKEQIIISPIQVIGSVEPHSVVSCAEYPFGVVVTSEQVGTFVVNLLNSRLNEKS